MKNLIDLVFLLILEMGTRQMIIEMKYTDSIKDNPIKNDWNDASIEELLNLCDESIELDLEQLNKIQEILLELEHNDSEDHTFLMRSNHFGK